MEAYAKKFGKGKEEVKQMGAWMKSKFDAAELPYNFTESALVSNTFDAHRVLTAAYKHGGAAAQDKAAEALFHSYFAKEKAPNDPEELKEAAKAAGLDATALRRGQQIGHRGRTIERLRVPLTLVSYIYNQL
ncbi:DSBA domain-containing protein (Fragment) [Durusdinium trenchii]|uniref:DSBA domain-containing protein n=1 Tax=Durusdinium trenchii TaxID=1381693 RepID=A0ABP0L9M7_9DINO